MGKKIKSYLAFTSPLYRIAVYLLVPAGMVGIGLWAGGTFGEMGVMFTAVLLPAAEILSDGWFLGGIQNKDAVKLNYLKTSGQGMKMLRTALIVDLIRKFFTALGTILVCYLFLRAGRAWDEIDISFSRVGMIGTSAWEEGAVLLYFVLFSYLTSVLGTFFSRYSGTLWMSMVIGYGAMQFASLCMLLLIFLNYIVVIDVFFCMISLGVSVLAVRVAMKKAEGGSYDQ